LAKAGGQAEAVGEQTLVIMLKKKKEAKMLSRRGKNGNQIGRSDIQKRQQRLKQELILFTF